MNSISESRCLNSQTIEAYKFPVELKADVFNQLFIGREN